MESTLIALLILLFVIVALVLFYLATGENVIKRYIINVVPRRHKGHHNKPHHQHRVIGGCAGTRWGCCPDGRTPKMNHRGSNC